MVKGVYTDIYDQGINDENDCDQVGEDSREFEESGKQGPEERDTWGVCPEVIFEADGRQEKALIP